MDVTTDYGMKQLLASCPNCQKSTLYCGKIMSKVNDLNSKEVLFCKTCKFVVPVVDYKKMLFTE
jgi:hypothetical protein